MRSESFVDEHEEELVEKIRETGADIGEVVGVDGIYFKDRMYSADDPDKPDRFKDDVCAIVIEYAWSSDK